MIVVTGASGMLGSNLVATVMELGRTAVALYNTNPIAIPGSKAYRCDLGTSREVVSRLQQFEPAWIVHCAAATNVDWCERNPEAAAQINVANTIALASAAREIGARVLFISTDSVFDGKRGGYTEEDATRPINTYAQTKRDAEDAVSEASADNLVVRTNLFGWSVFGTGLAEWMLKKLESGDRVPGFVDVRFSPVMAVDLANILIAMMDRQLSGLFHVGASDTATKYEFALEIAQRFGIRDFHIDPVASDTVDFAATRPKDPTLDSSKIQDTLGRSMPSVGEGVAGLQQLRASGYETRLKAFRMDNARN